MRMVTFGPVIKLYIPDDEYDRKSSWLVDRMNVERRIKRWETTMGPVLKTKLEEYERTIKSTHPKVESLPMIHLQILKTLSTAFIPLITVVSI